MDRTYTLADPKAKFILERILRITREGFHVPYVYPHQMAILADLADRCMERSVGARIYCLPTGAGKSLCFQAAGAALGGRTLIFYPLRALIREQARKLRALGFTVTVLAGGESLQDPAQIETLLAAPDQFVLASPETFMRPDIAPIVRRVQWGDVTIDEAHVLLGWGARFRPALLALLPFLRELRHGNLHFFTATLTEGDELSSRLLFDLDLQAPTFRVSPYRPNILLHWERPAAPLARLCDLACGCAGAGEAMLVFVRSRSACRILAERLHRRGMASVRFYHAGLFSRERTALERWFAEPGCRILIATNAYGLGMDKPDVRIVVHWRPPPSISDYFQEIGRAGRDGIDARAVLFRPRSAGTSWFDTDSVCRHEVVLSPFGDFDTPDCRCDRCRPELTAPLTRSWMSGAERWYRRYGRYLPPSDRAAVFAGTAPRDRNPFGPGPESSQAEVGHLAVEEEDVAELLDGDKRLRSGPGVNHRWR